MQFLKLLLLHFRFHWSRLNTILDREQAHSPAPSGSLFQPHRTSPVFENCCSKLSWFKTYLVTHYLWMYRPAADTNWNLYEWKVSKIKVVRMPPIRPKMLDRVSAFMQVYAHTISFKNLFATYQIFNLAKVAKINNKLLNCRLQRKLCGVATGNYCFRVAKQNRFLV